MSSCEASERMWTFADLQARLATVTTLLDLCALNQDVDERFYRDRPEITMSDDEWLRWTAMVRAKALQLEG